jgi:hypothetical protein
VTGGSRCAPNRLGAQFQRIRLYRVSAVEPECPAGADRRTVGAFASGWIGPSTGVEVTDRAVRAGATALQSSLPRAHSGLAADDEHSLQVRPYSSTAEPAGRAGVDIGFERDPARLDLASGELGEIAATRASSVELDSFSARVVNQEVHAPDSAPGSAKHRS